MKNGRIKSIISQLYELDLKWESHLLKNEEIPVQTSNKIKELKLELKNLGKYEEEGEIKSLLLNNNLQEETVGYLLREMGTELSFYKGLTYLRVREEEGEIELRGFIDAVYQNFILRFDTQFMSKWCSGPQGEEMRDVIYRMGFLTEQWVKNRASKNDIVRMIQQEVGLEIENCIYWAEIVEANYMELKLNYIMGQLKQKNGK